jgi:hypothetical protein
MDMKPKTCHYCKAEEGNPRPIGRFLVELTTVTMQGEEIHVCQSCHHKIVTNVNDRKKEQGAIMKITKTMKNVLFKIIPGILMILLLTSIAYAQSTPGPPGFPSTPGEAPIDGGLGLLAAAGGAYALKKLRDKKNQ